MEFKIEKNDEWKKDERKMKMKWKMKMKMNMKWLKMKSLKKEERKENRWPKRNDEMMKMKMKE